MKRRVLFILNSLNCGGEENFVMNLYRNISRENLDIIFMVPDNGEKQFFEDEIREKGDLIYKVPSKFRKPIKSFIETYKVVKKEKIDAVHRHSENSMMVWDLLAAKLGGAKQLIAHSHNSKVNGLFYSFLHYFCRGILNIVATDRLACSDVAGIWMYGGKDYRIVENGIDIEKFLPQDDMRIMKKRELKINDECVVLGHVGRFEPVKNHMFLIDILNELNQITPHKYKLLLLGTGSLEQEIHDKVMRLGLESEVIFLGVRKDVQNWLQVIDLFVFPSLFEGLPVSLVEAQASGTPCVISDSISKEIILTPLIKQMALDEGALAWADTISKTAKTLKKKDYSSLIRDKGFDIKSESNNLYKIYCGER